MCHHFFSAFSIRSQLSRLILFNSLWKDCLFVWWVCKSPNFLMRQCLAMLPSNFSTYLFAAPLDALVLSQWEEKRWTQKRSVPNQRCCMKVDDKHPMVAYRKSHTCCPYSVDGFASSENVGPSFLPVKLPTTLDILRPLGLVREQPINFLANNKLVAFLPPLCKLHHEIIVKVLPRTC